MGPRMYPVLAAASCLAGGRQGGASFETSKVRVHMNISDPQCGLWSLCNLDTCFEKCRWVGDREGKWGRRSWGGPLNTMYPILVSDASLFAPTRLAHRACRWGERDRELHRDLRHSMSDCPPEKTVVCQEMAVIRNDTQNVPGLCVPPIPKSIAKDPRCPRQGLRPLLPSSQIQILPVEAGPQPKSGVS